ncbi:TPA: methylated-DNA--[protein]-cysteine S-methyltransferase [Klebsiella pneumoniae]|nr:methylated-DNA--[protein]-cysteine S-methyltransferase [Escherichia coli]HBM3200146.1 methylated-DNA--[protein]-cysteine S-methyltransferase [Klebsiella michiganensis]HBW4829250.1 methylated-DNA--[protein]-cysteine S-methyltransferase [Klebsiella pneumoniae]HBW5248615.1 methylated-DNA--[protein]-cysteine S-methyltransferase [Klebsiella pneumoniae]HBW6210629.1 methylated-DNA--[protein]-cysteine S-methyltransferase [Klebsiella pneumoniae]
MYFNQYDSPLGVITLAADGLHLTGLWFVGQKYYAESFSGDFSGHTDLPVFTTIRRWLDAYFAGRAPSLNTLPLNPYGSAFRLAVWQRLCQIPYGEYVTYGTVARDVATALGKASMSAQATGGAVGHNPVSIIIPCHRVIGASNSLTGYAGGIARKIQLLELEGVNTSNMVIPEAGTAL